MLQESKISAWRAIPQLVKRGILSKVGCGYALTKLSSAPVPTMFANPLPQLSSGSQRGPGRSKPPSKPPTLIDPSISIMKKFRRLSIDPFQQQTKLDKPDRVVPLPVATPIIVSTGEMLKFENVKLLIDTREMQYHASSGKKKAFLKEKLEDKGIDCESRNLSVGDMIWIGITSTKEEYVLDYVVERKAIDDLCSSIIDGRYVEQKQRLQRSSFKRVIYLLEGDTNSMYNKKSGQSTFTSKTLQKSLCSTQVSTGFRTHQTKDLEDTAIFLARTTMMIQRKYIFNPDTNSTFPKNDFVTYKQSSNDNAKTGNLTVQDLFAKQLLQISGCSAEKAYSIVQLYPTLPSLFIAYAQTSTVQEGEVMLSNIKCGPSQRNLGPVLSKRIYHAYNDM